MNRLNSGRRQIRCCRCICSQMEHKREELVKCLDIIVGNPVELEKKKAAIRAAGLAKLQVIADFDMTLTKYWVDGNRGQSTHALLQQGNADYDLKREQLFDYYHPLEVCPTIPIDEKTKLMEEWFKRRGTFTQDTNLDALCEEVMRQKLNRNFKNVKVVSNRMVFDANGNLTGFRGKTIHVLNKNEHAIEMAAPIHDKLGSSDELDDNGASVVKDRTNVLLLGDHIGDLGMSNGLNYKNRISIAFLNDNVEKWVETYKQAFDIVLLNDASMWEVVDLVHELSS